MVERGRGVRPCVEKSAQNDANQRQGDAQGEVRQRSAAEEEEYDRSHRHEKDRQNHFPVEKQIPVGDLCGFLDQHNVFGEQRIAARNQLPVPDERKQQAKTAAG